MRTIKFRGRRIDNGEWVYGDLLQNGKITHISNFDNGVNREHCEVDPATVGQFTGLVDRNGVEVFEGDIVTHNGINVNAKINDYLVIEFKDAAFCVTAQNIVTGCDNSCDIREMQFQARRHGLEFIIEVIGNIHQDENLLKP